MGTASLPVRPSGLFVPLDRLLRPFARPATRSTAPLARELGGSTRPSGDGTFRASWRTVIGAHGQRPGQADFPLSGTPRGSAPRGGRLPPAPRSGGSVPVTTRGHSGRGLDSTETRTMRSKLRVPSDADHMTACGRELASTRSGRVRDRNATSAPQMRRARGVRGVGISCAYALISYRSFLAVRRSAALSR